MISPAAPARSSVVALLVPPTFNVLLGLVIVSPPPPEPHTDPVAVTTPETSSRQLVPVIADRTRPLDGEIVTGWAKITPVLATVSTAVPLTAKTIS